MSPDDRRRWLRRLVSNHADGDAGAIVEAIARRVVGGPALADGVDPILGDCPDPPGGWDDPFLIGAVHEVIVSATDRSARGAWYTPRSVVEELVLRAIPDDRPLPTSIVDPTCGGGAFLLAVLDRLVALGVDPAEAVDRVAGLDIDGGAVAATRLAVEAWARRRGVDDSTLRRVHDHVRVGDHLVDDLPVAGRPDLVIGNPPFATPLRGTPLPDSAVAARLARRDRLGPYADLAAIHLAAAIESGRPGGRVCFVLPQSLLAGRDTAALRDWIDATAPMQELWISRTPVFDAAVRVWAPVFEIGGDRGAAGSWAEQAALALGVPRVGPLSGSVLGDLVSATAGFRDEHYALAAACREQGDSPQPGELRVATVGSLDPLTSWWGRRPTRFAKHEWDRPVVDADRIGSGNRAWQDHQTRPKVLLPTQSRVFEPFVDRHGSVAAATPLISMIADESDLDAVAAVLLAPPVVAWAHARWFGAALSLESIKIAARDVAALPLPPDTDRWQAAAAVVASADGQDPQQALGLALEVGRIMNDAYGADPDVLEWWLTRMTLLLAS